MDGADGIESDALQAGGRRFEPCHVHQLFLIAKHLPDSSLLQSVTFDPDCARTGLLHRDCAHWSRRGTRVGNVSDEPVCRVTPASRFRSPHTPLVVCSLPFSSRLGRIPLVHAPSAESNTVLFYP